MKQLGGIEDMVSFGLQKVQGALDSLESYKETRERKWYYRQEGRELPEDYEDDIAEAMVISAISAFDLDGLKPDIVDNLEPKLSALATSLISGTSERDIFVRSEQNSSFTHSSGVT
jgi:hypothetical protein